MDVVALLMLTHGAPSCGVGMTVLCVPGSPVKAQNSGTFRMGDDSSSYETEANRQFAAPSGGGRQPLSRPERGGISFGSHKVDFSTSASDAFETGHAGRPGQREDPRFSSSGGPAVAAGTCGHAPSTCLRCMCGV